ncbi:hypothetical protein AUK10_00630 [Candidatus Gracilibacteria bacterium CG2_30_37_12]|nr:MAG: hypothetical protein AUK10_00630 [Candidatus Gracilibacteria bacterium CG2_30_37_12]
MGMKQLPENVPLIDTPSEGKYSGGIKLSTKQSMNKIIRVNGEIDFSTLIHCLGQSADVSINLFFSEKKHIEKILFPFFDFLKNTFFFENKDIPPYIVEILKNHPSIQVGLISYIKERNAKIISGQHIEQYDIIAFHLFLLGRKERFDLIQDIQHSDSLRTKTFLKDSIGDICLSPDITNANISTIQMSKLYCCLEIGETFNKLGLIHSANMEEQQISLKIGTMIRTYIHDLTSQLHSDIVMNNIIGKKLCNLSGRVRRNFAHGAPIDGKTRTEIKKQTEAIKREQQAGFDEEKASKFGENPRMEEISKIILMGNMTATDLRGLQQIEKVEGTLSPEEEKEKLQLIKNIILIYNFGVGKELLTTTEVINDFVNRGIDNEFQIEALHDIILHGMDITNESLRKLMDFFLTHKIQIQNLFYEESIIKIITQLIKKTTVSGEYTSFLPFIEQIYTSLAVKNISHSVLSYAKIYLSLALSYIKSDDAESIQKAERCFLHYKNLIDGNTDHIEEEDIFYNILGKVNEIQKYGKEAWKDGSIERKKGGIATFQKMQKQHQSDTITAISKRITDIIADITTTHNNDRSQENINTFLEKEIAEKLFYNLCTITITGNYQSCKTDSIDEGCQSLIQSGLRDIKHCELIPKKHGFEILYIDIGGMFIIFTYPSSSQEIITALFEQHKEYIQKNIGNLIRINHEHFLTLHDGDTGVFNEGKLKFDVLDGKSNIIVLMSISGYDNMVTTLQGTNEWGAMMKAIAIYLQQESQATIYKYNEMTFCLVYEPNDNHQISELELTELIEKLINHFHDIYDGKNKFHAGITLGQTENHLTYAYIALNKARNSEKGSEKGSEIYIFQTGDEKEYEKIISNRRLLNIALKGKDPNICLVPYYHIIVNLEDPNKTKYEALVRIEHMQEDGSIQIITPDKFMPIAEYDKTVSQITVRMINQVIVDVRQDKDMDVSINFGQQDWHDDKTINILEALCTANNIDTRKICIEVLETSQFSREAGQERIQQVKKHGFKISLDDYGTERGNLEKLVLLKPDYIKLDRCLVEQLNISNVVKELESKLLQPDIGERESKNIQTQIDDLYSKKKYASAIIRSTVLLATDINAVVIAEHVENKEVFHDLQELGVKNFQGYYFAKPLPFSQLKKSLENIRALMVDIGSYDI